VDLDIAAPLRPLDAGRRRRRRARHPERMIAYSFAAVIMLGTALLMLPFATHARDGAPFVDALFTSTSAVCVTGLASVDTGSYWSPFGQVVILLLIQVGGLGIMTLATIGLVLLGRRIGLRRRVLGSADKGGQLTADLAKRLFFLVAVLTFAFEATGTVIFALRLATAYDYPAWKAFWYGLFHAVSAFNNAGFGLLPTNLTPFVEDWPINLVVMTLIVAGGLGFPVWLELFQFRFVGPGHLSIHSKMMLVGTAFLLVVGTLSVLVLEWNNPGTLGQFSPAQKLLPSMFQSVTPRTAGFNTLDYSQMHEATWLTQMMLMFVGAGPASTGGGIKVTTLFVLFLFVTAEARGVPDTVAFGRRIPLESIRQGFSIAYLAQNAVVIGTLVMLMAGGDSFVRLLFEAFSAFGTVGLSTGITFGLPDVSKYVLVALMYFGRVGPYTLAAAFALRQRPVKFRYAAEAPIIG
jgi:potassium uptake TrkH family protein